MVFFPLYLRTWEDKQYGLIDIDSCCVCSLQGYDIYYTLAENAADRDINAWSLKQCGGSVNLVLLDGLLSNERYAVVISARNRIGTGPRSQPVEFIMVEGGKGDNC